MLTNPTTLTLKPPLFSHNITHTRKPISAFNQSTKFSARNAPQQITSSNSCFESGSVFRRLSFSNGTLFNGCNIRLGKMGVDKFGVFAVSDGGTGDNAGSGRGSGSSWSLLSWYLAMLSKYPVMTKAITSALLTFVGDLICQIAIDRVPTLDWKRTFPFTFLGLVLVGPTLHFWYLYLSKLVTLTGASGALLRLVIDQFVFSPIFIGVFLSALVTLEGRASLVVPKLQQEWFSSVLANWKLWIPLQFLNFRFIPQQYQVLAANAIAVVWNVILSFKAHKAILP